MPSFYPKRGDALTLTRFRELFRKKRDGDGEAEVIRELLHQDRGDLLREIERILEARKSAENMPFPSELRTVATLRSIATQTDLPKEVRQPTSPGRNESLAETRSYTSSSTQVDLLDGVEENRPPSSSQLPRLDSLSSSGSPAVGVSRLSPNAPFIFGKESKMVEDIQSPRPKLEAHSLRQTKSTQSLSSQNVSNKPKPPPEKCVLAHRQTYRVDDNTGAIFLSETTKLRWKDRYVIVRLPPQSFQGHKLKHTESGLFQERPLPQVFTDEGEWEDVDDEDINEGKDNAKEVDTKNLTGFKTFNPALYKGSVYRF
jgi:hypothetical protein